VPRLYLAASAGLAWWWLLGHLLLWNLGRFTRPVPESVRARFLALSGPAGARVRLLDTDRVALPFTYTWGRPTIVLPRALTDGDDAQALRYVLAHEWSHIERRDVRAWNAVSVITGTGLLRPAF
jgi:Zn-dependent protease with chaperone function